MDIICKEKYNVIFWRNSATDEWENAPLDEVVDMYRCEPYCALNYWTTVHEEGTGKELYHLFNCSECGAVVATLDKVHDLNYCPHCGKMIFVTNYPTEEETNE